MSLRVATSSNNFARAKIDHDMNGRFDLPIYQSGVDACENFITNFKGNGIYRAGFENMVKFQDCVLVEFKFKNDQQYICLFYASKIRFLSYDSNNDFGWVLDGSMNILEVVSPYSLAQARDMDYAQNNDVMYTAHTSAAPYKLTRVSASSFTMATYTRTNDPFTTSTTYPSKVCFYKSRLYFAAPTSKPTTIYGSVSNSYDDFTASPVTKTSAFTFTLADISQPIEWLFPGDNSLIVGASDGIVAVNGGDVNTSITAENIEATLTSAPACNDAYPVAKDGLVFYVGLDGRNIHYFSYDLLSEAFQAESANTISYDITQGGMTKIRHKEDRNDLIFAITDNEDKSMLSLNFNLKEKIIGWHEHITEGEFLDEAVITDNNGIPQLFSLVKRGSNYFIERHAEYIAFRERRKFFTGKSDEEKASDDIAYRRFVAEQLKQCNYLDGSLTLNNLKEGNLITYNSVAGTITANSSVFSSGDVGKQIVYKTETGYESGRFEITAYTSGTVVEVDVLQAPTSNTYSNWYLTFSTISGLTDYIGMTLGVVADGGYLDDFVVDGSGEIDLGKQVTSIVVGYRYKGLIKSFCLGFQIQTVNTQTTVKNISEFAIRCVASAGLEVGSSPYKTEPVQLLTPDTLNYLPPVPMDGTKRVQYTDDAEEDKFFYVIQDAPLPAVVTGVLITGSYSVTP